MTKLADKIAERLSRFKPFGKGADDPLTSLKSATRWAESLPVGDALKSQGVVLAELKRFNENLTQLSKDRLSVLMLLDEKSQDLQDTLVQQYLRNPRMSRAVESQLWHGINRLYWEIARAYHAFVLDFARSAGKNHNEALVPLITLRAIRVFGLLLKWRAIRYLQPGEKLWLRLHNLYRVAENEGFHQRKQKAYPQDNFESTCESAYLHILMLNLANSGTLYPRQLHLVDRWLRNWHDMLSLENRLEIQNHSFAVDLSADHGPRRVRNPDGEKPMRYWGAARLLEQLNGIQTAIREGSPPAQLGLTEESRTAESVDMLAHLQRQWSALASREQRRAPRENIKRMVDMTHGLGNIISQVKFAGDRPDSSPYGDIMPYDEAEDVQVYGFVTERTRERATLMKAPLSATQSEVERWIMQDESECGYGSNVETRDKDWLRVGALVASKPHESKAWHLGVIRRLSRLNEESSSVGIETLTEPPCVVMLYDTTSSSGYTVNGFDNTGAKLPIACLWLHSGDGTAILVMDPAHFQPHKVFEIHGLPDLNFVALGDPVERSEGWILVVAEPVKS